LTILVTGGAGYIGSHCVRALAAAGYDCVVYDNLSSGHREAVYGFPLVAGDLSDVKKLKATLSDLKIGGVVHFAAHSLVAESVADPLKYYENNIGGTVSLLAAMRTCGVDKIVFSSSAAVYGAPGRTPITEAAPAKPVNPYGETKLAIERLLRAADTAYGMKSVALRYFNAAGAAPDGNIGEAHAVETHLVPLVLREARTNGGSLKVFGGDYPTPDGSAVRDYVHVLDLADAHVLALQYLINGGKSGCFNLGTGSGASVLEIIQAARDVTGADIAYELAGRRAGDPAVLVAGADKAKRVLGWRPSRSGLFTMIRDAYRWHSRHPDGFGK
jgi:UDP-glucose 4-epimerase